MPDAPKPPKNIDSGPRDRLLAWVNQTLSQAPAEGEGRNNWIVMLTPRMLELGWEQDDIFMEFKESFDLADDYSKDEEIRKAIASAAKYQQAEIVERDAKQVLKERAEKQEAQRQAARTLATILRECVWTEAQIVEAGGVEAWTPEEQTQSFLGLLFKGDDTVWLGEKWHSGEERHRANFRTVDAWRRILPAYEFTSHCTFKPGSVSRCNEAVAEHRYLVVESDELGRDQVGSVFCWMGQRGLKLRAVVFSGNESLHGWFDWPNENEVHELRATLKGLRCDPSTTRASQPVRLAGRKRKDSGLIQKLLYIDP